MQLKKNQACSKHFSDLIISISPIALSLLVGTYWFFLPTQMKYMYKVNVIATESIY